MSELLSAAEGRKVLSRDDAEDVGTVKTAVFDARVQRIVSLHVSGAKRKAELVEWTDVAGFGPDAVVITSADRLREAHDDESAAVSRKINPLGARLLDDLGDQHGAVRDVRFNPESGLVEAIIGAGGEEWQPDEVYALGSFALVVRHR
jgi:uncharacterized protein YrrD